VASIVELTCEVGCCKTLFFRITCVESFINYTQKEDQRDKAVLECSGGKHGTPALIFDSQFSLSLSLKYFFLIKADRQTDGFIHKTDRQVDL
jgi:hypothetical protein